MEKIFNVIHEDSQGNEVTTKIQATKANIINGQLCLINRCDEVVAGFSFYKRFYVDVVKTDLLASKTKKSK